MVASYQSVSSNTVAAGVTSNAIPKPSGTAAGDLLVALVSDGSADLIPFAAPGGGGWTAGAETLWTSQGSASSFYRIAGGSEPSSYTFTRTGGTGVFVGTMVRISAADTTTPVADSSAFGSGSGGTTSPDMLAVTAATADTLLLQMLNIHATGGTASPPGGTTEVYDQATGGTVRRMAGGTETVGSGSSGLRSWTLSASQQVRGAMFAINPAGTGATVNGGLISETTTLFAGTVTSGVAVAASLITEAATVFAGSVTLGGFTVFGGVVAETTSVLAGVTSTGVLVEGGVVSETTTVLAGSAPDSGTVMGGLVTETTVVHSGILSFGGYTPGDTDNAADGIIIDGTATVQWTPDVTPLPGGFYPRAHDSYDVAQAFSLVTMSGAQPSYDVTFERVSRLRPRVVIGGADRSFFRGYETIVEDYQLVEPFLYSTANLTFPAIVAPFEKPGEGALAFLAKGTRMSIEMVDDEAGEVVSTVYKGIVSAWNPSGRDLRVECLGEVRGPASTRYKPQTLIPWRHDAGRIITRMLRNLDVAARPRLGVETGYVLGEPGGTWMLEALEDMHAQAWTLGGDQWTTMPDPDGVYRTALKDRDTVHMTAYPDDARVVVDLRSDITEEPNRIFGTGTTPDGMRINNGVYPGMIEGDVPAFPGTLSLGDSGDDVGTLIHRLRTARYLNANDSPGGFDADVVDSVKELQEDAGLSQTGVVDNPTWRALWDLDVTGASVRGAGIVPMAQRSYTRKWFHTGGGAFTSRNPNFDRARQFVDLPVDFGAKQRRNQMVRRSKALLAGVEEQWVGSITITTGAVVEGDHTPGDPIVSVMRAVDIRPGMNIKLPSMLGDRLLHIAGVNVQGRRVTLAVDTKARDAVPVWQIHERDRESRKDPNRSWLREQRSSFQVRDTLGEYSEVGGINDRRRTLIPDEWIVFQVISGPISGTIRSIALDCGSGVEFSVAVFGMRMNAARMNNLVPNPLSESGQERWTDPEIQAKLKERVILAQFGTFEDPCGYHPKRKSRDSAIITGEFEDDSSFPFRSIPPLTSALVGDEPLNRFAEPVLYVAVYANASGYVRPGRVMWPQAEGAV